MIKPTDIFHNLFNKSPSCLDYGKRIMANARIYIRRCVNGTFNVNLCQTKKHDTINDRLW